MHEYIECTFVRTLLCLLLVASSACSRQVTIDTTTARFAVIGDFGYSLNEHEGKVAALVRSWDPEFIITLGDNRYGTIDYDLAVGQYFCEFLFETETGRTCSGGDALSNAFFPTPSFPPWVTMTTLTVADWMNIWAISPCRAQALILAVLPVTSATTTS